MGIIEIVIVLAVVAIVATLLAKDRGLVAKGVLLAGGLAFAFVVLGSLWSLNRVRSFEHARLVGDSAFPSSGQVEVVLPRSSSIGTPVVAPKTEATSRVAVIAKASLPDTKATGHFVGRDSKAWDPEIELANVADVFSSDLEATRSLARQFVALYLKLTDVTPTDSNLRPVNLRMDDNDFGNSQRTLFKREIREQIPTIRLITSINSDEAIHVTVSETDNSIAHLNPIRSCSLKVQMQPGEESYELAAKYVEKPWVKNEVEFRESGNAPNRYLVVWGEYEKGVRTCVDLAASEIESRVAYQLEVTSSRHSTPTSEAPKVSKVVVDSLVMDHFVQRFERNVDGTKLASPIEREALLLSLSDVDLTQAVRAATQGSPYTVQPFTKRKAALGAARSPQQHRYESRLSPPFFYGFGAVFLGCFGVLKGFSWFFDR